MFELVTGISDLALTMPTGSVHADTLASFVTSVPDIEPDLSSSFAQAAIRLTAIIAGVCVVACVLALAVCGALIAFKGFGNSRALEAATTGSLWCLAGLVILGSLTGIAAWAVDFKVF